LEKFKSFITEEETKPYRVLVLKRDVPEDTNNTGDSLEKQAKKMGIDLYQMEVESSYFTTNEKGNLVAHNYENFRERTKGLSFGDEVIKHDKKGWEINPENTICFVRVTLGRAIRFAEQLRIHGVTTVNSRYTNLICDDKWLNYLALKKDGLRQPKTSILTHEENINIPISEIGGKYPMILKTAQGTQGVGVVFIDSYQTLVGTMQLIKKIDEDMGILIQEYIKTPFDVRAHVLNGEVVAKLKRPVISGDFRSNISQGSEPQKIELTDLEKSECIKAAKSVKGMWVGVDFIPSKDREKELPYFIEINHSPGTGHIDELNDINISEMVLETFREKDNWS
jgi:ribosomal protein S6--L-glutamate ligase